MVLMWPRQSLVVISDTRSDLTYGDEIQGKSNTKTSDSKRKHPNSSLGRDQSRSFMSKISSKLIGWLFSENEVINKS